MELFPRGEKVWDMRLTIYLRLMHEVKNEWSYNFSPSTPSWRVKRGLLLHTALLTWPASLFVISNCDLSCTVYIYIYFLYIYIGRFQCSRGLRRRSMAARLLGLRVRIPPGAWMSVCCECCVLSGRGLCDGLIYPSEDSYRVCVCVYVCVCVCVYVCVCVCVYVCVFH